MSIDTVCLLKVLRDDRSVADLRDYFNIDHPRDRPRYPGARFESLGDGGARDEVRDKITPWDLLALQCLSVTMPIPVGLDLVEGSLGRDISCQLEQIPTNVVLGEPGARSHVHNGSPADQAWWCLKSEFGVGKTIAGKLMARKRPCLIPVWDDVVKCAFGKPDDAWLWLDDLIRQPDGVLKARLDELHQEATLSALVSRIRVLDVVVWMRHHDVHRRYKLSSCPGLC
jgi:hypothetical protein